MHSSAAAAAANHAAGAAAASAHSHADAASSTAASAQCASATAPAVSAAAPHLHAAAQDASVAKRQRNDAGEAVPVESEPAAPAVPVGAATAAAASAAASSLADDAGAAVAAAAAAAPVTRYACLVEYCGTGYHGWSPSAERARDLSVAGAIEMAIEPLAAPGTRVKIIGSGRTDAGVHALGQVFHVDLDRGAGRVSKKKKSADADGTVAVKPAPVLTGFKFAGAVNYRLEAAGHTNIRILHASIVPDDMRPRFHARHRAASRSYLYRLWVTPAGSVGSLFEHRRCWHVRYPIDVDQLRRALQMYLGVHDFAAFQANGCTAPSSVRLVSEARVEAEPPPWHSYEARMVGPGSAATVAARGRELAGQLLSIRVSSRSFLYHQVRHMVGVAVAVASGRWTLAQLEDALRVDSRAAMAGDEKEAARVKRMRHQVGVLAAPASGLYLHRVDYPYAIDTWERRPTVSVIDSVPLREAAELVRQQEMQMQQHGLQELDDQEADSEPEVEEQPQPAAMATDEGDRPPQSSQAAAAGAVERA